MIDRLARDQLAEGIRHLVAGLITNVEFENRTLRQSSDPAIHAVFLGGPWMLYHDIIQYRLRGAHRLEPVVRREAARWILFLKTDLPYEWPVKRHGIPESLGWVVLCLLTLGYCARISQRRFSQHGNIDVWPFIRRPDLDAALTHPPYLKPPSNFSSSGRATSARRST